MLFTRSVVINDRFKLNQGKVNLLNKSTLLYPQDMICQKFRQSLLKKGSNAGQKRKN